MNSRHFTINGLLALIIIFILFTGCNKEKLVGEYYLTDEMKQTVPFDGSETIYFIDGEDTIILNQGRRNNYINKIYISQTEYTYGEKNDTKFNKENNNYNIFLILQSNYYYNPGRMKVIWGERNNNALVNEGEFHFRLPLSTTTLEQGQWYIDKMEVQGINYINVYCDSIGFIMGTDGPNHPKKVYYTEEAGIIKIDFTQGNSWELLKIDWD